MWNQIFVFTVVIFTFEFSINIKIIIKGNNFCFQNPNMHLAYFNHSEQSVLKYVRSTGSALAISPPPFHDGNKKSILVTVSIAKSFMGNNFQ